MTAYNVQFASSIAYEDGKLPAYAWPGGYPLYYLSREGDTFCPDCANQADAEPEIVYYETNWEDEDLFCDGCAAQIHSAYGDDND
jgi:hypothetical protein